MAKLSKKNMITAAKFIAVGVIGALLSNFADDAYNYVSDWLVSLGQPEIADLELKEDTIALYTDIMEFLTEREKNEPEIEFDNWEESTNRRMEYSRETMGLYHERFGSRVVIIREEYLRRGVKSDKLDQFYTHPTNPLGIREVAYGLAELAGKLSTIQ